MKVIFTDNIQGVAFKGDIKNVKRGYYRNYLLPFKKATIATAPLLKEWEEKRKRLMIAKEQLKAKLEEIKSRIAGSKIQIEKKVTKKGTLYGGVKAADIVKVLKEKLNLELPESAIVLAAPIKEAGTCEIQLNLGEGIMTSLPFEIVEKA